MFPPKYQLFALSVANMSGRRAEPVASAPRSVRAYTGRLFTYPYPAKAPMRKSLNRCALNPMRLRSLVKERVEAVAPGAKTLCSYCQRRSLKCSPPSAVTYASKAPEGVQHNVTSGAIWNTLSGEFTPKLTIAPILMLAFCRHSGAPG